MLDAFPLGGVDGAERRRGKLCVPWVGYGVGREDTEWGDPTHQKPSLGHSTTLLRASPTAHKQSGPQHSHCDQVVSSLYTAMLICLFWFQ